MKWSDLVLSSGKADQIWELFHENSKIGRLSFGPSEQEVRARITRLHEVLPFEGYPLVKLPRMLEPLKLSLARTIMSRCSVNEMTPCTLTLRRLSTLLHYAYGVRAYDDSTPLHRSLRVVPSAGALYPLEIFVYCKHINGLASGLYHYNSVKMNLRRLRQADETRKLTAAIIRPDVTLGSSLLIFITAVFERSVFKYGDRGYRFVLLEAGHVAQNINLAANALGLGCLNVGGYYDREIDEYLDLDGVTHSTIYVVAVGKKQKLSRPEKGKTGRTRRGKNIGK